MSAVQRKILDFTVAEAGGHMFGKCKNCISLF